MRRGRIFLVAVSLALLGVLVARIGPRTLLEQLAAVLSVLPILLTILGLRLGVRTWNWWSALRAEGVPVSPGRVLGARLASEALGYLSVLGPLVAEPMKPLLLGRQAPVQDSAAATIVDSSLYWLSSAVLILVGSVVGALHTTNRAGAITLVLVAVVVLAAAVILPFRKQPVIPKLCRALLRLVGRRPRFLGAMGKAAAVEARVRSFRHRHPNTATAIFLRSLAVQSFMLAEVVAVLWALDIEFRLADALAVEAAIRTAKLAGFFVPGRIGVDEGGAAGAFLLFGLSPAAGIALAIARRVQALIWCAAGLVWLSLDRRREKRKDSTHAGSDLITHNP